MSSFHHGHKYELSTPKSNRRNLINKPSTNTGSKDLISLITGIGGVVIFYFWIAGRMYAAGYFTAMNIPIYMVNFPTWEYIEQSWFRLLLFLVIYTLTGTILLTLIRTIWHWLILLLRKFVPEKVRNLFRSFRPLSRLMFPDLQPSIRLFRYLFNVLIILILFSILLIYIFLIGLHNGNKNVFSAQSIEISSSSNTPFQYSNLRLLTYNQGKYFVFNEIDQTTCKPQVMVLDESYITAIEIGQTAMINFPECKSDAISFWFFELPIKFPKKLYISPK